MQIARPALLGVILLLHPGCSCSGSGDLEGDAGRAETSAPDARSDGPADAPATDAHPRD
jgi:hypothetical protein